MDDTLCLLLHNAVVQGVGYGLAVGYLGGLVVATLRWRAVLAEQRAVYTKALDDLGASAREILASSHRFNLDLLRRSILAASGLREARENVLTKPEEPN